MSGKNSHKNTRKWGKKLKKEQKNNRKQFKIRCLIPRWRCDFQYGVNVIFASVTEKCLLRASPTFSVDCNNAKRPSDALKLNAVLTGERQLRWR